MPKVHQPVLVFVRGMYGSGKSYLTERLSKTFDAQQIVVLDPDATDYDSAAYKAHTAALSEEGVDENLHPYRFLRAQAYQAIADGKIILWNQPFGDREIFHKVVGRMKETAAEQNKQLTILIVEVTIDPATAKERVAARKAAGGHGPSENTLTRGISNYASFADEGFQTVTVRGDDDVTNSVAIVKKAIEDCLSFM